MDRFNEFVKVVCAEYLNIEAPELAHSLDMITNTNLAFTDINNNIIYIKSNEFNALDLLFAIAHELRHIWQATTNYDFYFTNYKKSNEIDINDYNLQIAEIDANAFATIVMDDAFGLTPLLDGIPDDIKSKIASRMEEIRKQK